MKLSNIFLNCPDQTLFIEDHAIDINMSDFPDFDPKYAKIVGTIDGRDVWASRYYPGYHVFAFRTNRGELQAFVVINDQHINDAYPLTRLWSLENKETAGMITALISFLLRKLQFKLVITDDEPLTPKGWNSLIRGAERGSFTAKNAKTGQLLTAQELKNARQSLTQTPLAVLLEAKKSKYPVFGTGYRQLSEPILFVGSKNLD